MNLFIKFSVTKNDAKVMNLAREHDKSNDDQTSTDCNIYCSKTIRNKNIRWTSCLCYRQTSSITKSACWVFLLWRSAVWISSVFQSTLCQIIGLSQSACHLTQICICNGCSSSSNNEPSSINNHNDGSCDIKKEKSNIENTESKDCTWMSTMIFFAFHALGHEPNQTKD